MNTKIFLTCFSLLFLLGFVHVQAIGDEPPLPFFKVEESKNNFYQKENINLNLSLAVPHNPLKAEYYIVNTKTKKKSYLGTFDLEKMSIGFTAGLILEQKPGTYYYLVVLTENKIKTQYTTKEITVLNRSKIATIKIKDFDVVFSPLPYYEQKTDQEYKISFISKSDQQFSDIFSNFKIKCSSNVTLYEKGGEAKCSKRSLPLLSINGGDFDYSFLIDADDLKKDVKMQVEYKLVNILGKTLDTVKKKITLSNK